MRYIILLITLLFISSCALPSKTGDFIVSGIEMKHNSCIIYYDNNYEYFVVDSCYNYKIGDTLFHFKLLGDLHN